MQSFGVAISTVAGERYGAADAASRWCNPARSCPQRLARRLKLLTAWDLVCRTDLGRALHKGRKRCGWISAGRHIQKRGSERWVWDLGGEKSEGGSEYLLGVRACEPFMGAVVCLDEIKVKRGLAPGLSFGAMIRTCGCWASVR